MRFNDRLKDWGNRVSRIFNPSSILDDSLKKYLEDYFSNSNYFSFKEMNITKKGFSFVLDYNPEKLSNKDATVKKDSFSDYLPEPYRAYSLAYQSLYRYVESLGDFISRTYERMIMGLEESVNRISNFGIESCLTGGNLRVSF